MTEPTDTAPSYTPNCKCSEATPTWPVFRPHAHLMSCPWFHIELQRVLMDRLQERVERLESSNV